MSVAGPDALFELSGRRRKQLVDNPCGERGDDVAIALAQVQMPEAAESLVEFRAANGLGVLLQIGKDWDRAPFHQPLPEPVDMLLDNGADLEHCPFSDCQVRVDMLLKIINVE